MKISKYEIFKMSFQTLPGDEYVSGLRPDAPNSTKINLKIQILSQFISIFHAAGAMKQGGAKLLRGG